MPSGDPLFEIIEKIYQAAAEPEEWVSLCSELRELFGTNTAMLLQHDPRTGKANFLFDSLRVSYKEPTAAAASYQQYYIKKSTLVAPMLRLRPGEVLTDHGNEHTAAYLASEAYNDFFMPNGIARSMVMPIDKPQGEVRYISFRRDAAAGFFDVDQQAILQRLHPHLERAFRVTDELAQARALREAFEASLDQIPGGIALLDRGGRVLFMNSAAERILNEGDGMRLLRDGSLVFDRPDDNERYRKLLASALGTDDGGLENGFGGAMAVGRPSLRRPYGVQVAPLPDESGERKFVRGANRPAAMVVVKDPEHDQALRAADVAAVMGLTRREAELAVALAEGLSVPDIADKLGITEGTARYYIKQILQKTETSRQSELVGAVTRSVPAIGRRETG